MRDDAFALDLEHVEELLPRYAVEGPRYTSYPTAPVWTESYGPEQLRAELGRDDITADEPLSIYVHVPFCTSLCHYCACNKVITRDPELAKRYLDAIDREVAAVHDAVRVPRRTTQHHWGGGTPTYLTPEQTTRLFATVNAAFPVADGAEVSIEVDPRVTTDEHVAALRESGFNRISMGVQDFEPVVQEAVHRIQPAEDTGRLVESARRAGFESVNFDLIYGLPYQTPETFGRTLDTVMELSPDRIALYSYAHVTWVAKQQRGFERKDLPDANTKLAIMLLAIRRFLEAGYLFIGLDHFARPDDELAVSLRDGSLRRNFMGHTTQAGVDMIGFGPSAISELRGSYAQSQRDLPAWHAAVESDGVATMRGHRLSGDDIERRWIIGRIMCHGELRAGAYREEFGRDFATRYRAELAALAPAVTDGLVTLAGDGSLGITALGRLLVRNVAMHFDAYLPEQQKSGKRMFSKTV
jgi:oxygen-independent coproporphyrinogen-3 oxidase